MVKKAVVDLLTKATNLPEDEINKLLEVPPSSELGDYAFPCFVLSKQFKKSPNDIAAELSMKIAGDLKNFAHIESVKAVGPYLNIFVNKVQLAKSVVSEVLKKKEKYGMGKGKEKIVIEFPSPNTNKPLHLGHLRNMSIGESVSRVLEFNGKKVVRVNLNNDRGVHICKSMLAYQRWGSDDSPEKSGLKSDHFVGKYYVLFAQKAQEDKNLEIEAQEMLRKWEAGDKETLALWKKMNKWALDGFKETYKAFGVGFDKNYYESRIYDRGKDIVLKGLKGGKFKEKDGAVIADLASNGLGEKVLIRKDGTSIYITQDIFLAKLKYDDFKPDRSLIVVGNEQNYHFKVLAEVCKILGMKSTIHHLSYGMVNLPEGRMKSREGTVVDADDLISEVGGLVEEEIKTRYSGLDEKEIRSRSLAIALSAIKYHLLRIGVEKDMVYNPKESISFEGNTGPYLQYSHARASSILRKAKEAEAKKSKKVEIDNIEKSEFALAKLLGSFSDVVFKANNDLDPSIIANYSYDLAKCFNEFYHSCTVIGSDCEGFRLSLVDAFRIVMKNCLHLLGIEAIEEM